MWDCYEPPARQPITQQMLESATRLAHYLTTSLHSSRRWLTPWYKGNLAFDFINVKAPLETLRQRGC